MAETCWPSKMFLLNCKLLAVSLSAETIGARITQVSFRSMDNVAAHKIACFHISNATNQRYNIASLTTTHNMCHSNLLMQSYWDE